MPASVNYSVIGASAPFTFSVKNKDNVEVFLNNDSSKIYFTAASNGIYNVTISKGNCTVTSGVLISNCPVAPTASNPTPVAVCSIPELKLVKVFDDKRASFTVANIADCKSMEFQYSTNINFTSIQKVSIPCSANQIITFPTNTTYYVRVAKTCINNLLQYSNVIQLTTEVAAANCIVSSGCKNLGITAGYDTYRIALNSPASQDITFLLSSGTTIILTKGSTFVEQSVSTINGCPTIVSNNVNISNCQNPILVYNLKLCNGDNASRQLINEGKRFSEGTVIYDNVNKICYTVVGLGAQVSSLITSYQEGYACGQGLCNVIPTPITVTPVVSCPSRKLLITTTQEDINASFDGRVYYEFQHCTNGKTTIQSPVTGQISMCTQVSYVINAYILNSAGQQIPVISSSMQLFPNCN